MSDLDRKASVSVSINGEQAKKELEELKKIGKGLQTQLAKAHEKGNQAAIERVNKEIQKNKSEMNKMKRLAYDVQFAMQAMDSASPRELRRTLRAINEQMQSGKVARGSAEWDEYAKAASRVKAELAQINQETKAAEPLVTRLGSSLKSAFTGWIGGAALIGGATFSAAQAIEAYTSIQESLGDVKKYTDLTSEGIEELQEKLKKLDTRKTREQLNALVGEAGRLGIQGVDALYDFVYASDILDMALGSDLGEDGIKNIGKLTQMYGEDKTLGLRGAMLATGSTINELAQASSASEPYILDFTARIGGVAKTANISQTSIMGFASVLDQNMQSLERSSTALQNVILKMTSAPQKYAEIAGVSVKEFTDMLKTDANAALLQFLEGLNRMGELTDMSPILKDLQLSGSGMASTLTSLAQNLDAVREVQALANKAYAEGNSVIEEASIVNNTAAAQIEKKKNQLRELSAELGEKLLPVQLSAMDGLKQIMKVLATTAKFIYDNKTAVTTLVAAWAAYVVVSKTALLWNQKIASIKTILSGVYLTLTGSINKAVVAIKAMNAATKANLFGALASAVVLAASAIYNLYKRTTKFQEATKDLHVELEKEKASLELLVGQFRKTTKGTNDYETAKKDLQNRYGELLTSMQIEVDKLYDSEEAYNKLTKAIETNTRAKLKNQYIEQYAKDSAEEIGELYADLRTSLISKFGEETGRQLFVNLKEQIDAGEFISTTTEENLVNLRKVEELGLKLKDYSKIVSINTSREKLEKDMKKLDDIFGKDLKPITPIVKESTPDNPDPDDPNPDPIEPTKTPQDSEQLYKDRLAKLDTYHAIEKAKIAAYYANGLIDKAQYDSQVEQLDIEVMQQRIELYEEGTKERAELEEKLLLKQKEIGDRNITQSRETLKAEADAQRNAYGQAYIDGEMSHESYLQNMFNTELQYQQNLAKTYAEGSNERAEIEKRIQDMLIRDKTEKERAFQQARQQLIKQYSDVGAEEMYNLEMEALNSLHAEKLISEENFQKAKKDIEERYQGDLSENFLESEAGQNMINKTQFALSQMQTIMGGFNNYMMAEADAQIASIDRKYEAEIKAAGGNQARVKQIEERKQKEIAKVKAKYADRALVVQMAMAVAQAVQGAINAYSSTAAIPIIGPGMAPVAAGIALAAGMLNVAAIKKQHAVAKQGFYKGGFTGNGRWDEEKGVVHAKEFVANRHAVDNPAVRPVLDFIDTAQRNNTIGSITEEDISRQLYPTIMGRATAPAQSDTPVVDNSALIDTLAFTASTVKELKERLAEPFVTINTVDGDYGMKRAFDDYNAQEKNKSR